MSDLQALLIPTAGGLKPLGSLTTIEIRNAGSAIERREGRRVAQMHVTGSGGDDRAFHDEVQQVLAETKLPPGVRFDVGGSWEDLQQNFDALGKALLLGAALVFLLTGALFEALLLPLAVITAVVPAIVGAIWALYLTGKPMDELSFLGVILLVGVVVNNGIVLVDRVQQRRREGLPLRAAVRLAGADRLRPVLMTAGTTIVGLLPMAMFRGGNDEIPYDTLATAVIGGLIVATVVTLLLVPVVFTFLVQMGDFSRRTWRGTTGTRRTHA
jgi:HAE1 family hydrophobic/amphiphilic exporter-1